MSKGEKDIVVTITSGTIVRTMLFLVLAAGVYFFWDLLLVVLMAVVIASAVEPAILSLRRLKIPRLLAVIMVYLSSIAAVAALLFFFVPLLLSEASDFLSTIPASFDTKDILGPLIANGPSVLRPGIEDFSASFSPADLINNLRITLTQNSQGILAFARAVFGSVMSLILVIVLSFYFSVQENGIENFLRIVTPLRNKRYVFDLWKRSQFKIGRWMQGQFVLGLLIGVLVYLGLAIFGVKHALLLAVLAAVFEIIPVFGPILAAIPAILIAYVGGLSNALFVVESNATAGLIVALFYIVVQQFENQLIYPLVVRKVVGVPPLLVILALIIGARLAGFLGVILSVPVAAAILEFVTDIGRDRDAAEKRLEKTA